MPGYLHNAERRRQEHEERERRREELEAMQFRESLLRQEQMATIAGFQTQARDRIHQVRMDMLNEAGYYARQNLNRAQVRAGDAIGLIGRASQYNQLGTRLKQLRDKGIIARVHGTQEEMDAASIMAQMASLAAEAPAGIQAAQIGDFWNDVGGKNSASAYVKEKLETYFDASTDAATFEREVKAIETGVHNALTKFRNETTDHTTIAKFLTEGDYVGASDAIVKSLIEAMFGQDFTEWLDQWFDKKPPDPTDPPGIKTGLPPSHPEYSGH